MSRRFRPTDAFVDESIRGQRYLMGCVLVEARHLPTTRAAVAAMPTRGRRLHFNNEDDPQRRLLLSAFAELPVQAFVVVCHRKHGITEFAAREACLAAIVTEVQALHADRLVVETRQDDREGCSYHRPRPATATTVGLRAPCGTSGANSGSRRWDHLGRGSGYDVAVVDRADTAASHRTSPVMRRTRFPHLRVGNRVHFLERLPEADPVCTSSTHPATELSEFFVDFKLRP